MTALFLCRHCATFSRAQRHVRRRAVGRLSRCGLDAIAALLRAGAPISSLSLRGNRLREQGAAILAAALPHAAALERLDVRETEMFAAEAELRAAWGRAERTTLLI